MSNSSDALVEEQRKSLMANSVPGLFVPGAKVDAISSKLVGPKGSQDSLTCPVTAIESAK